MKKLKMFCAGRTDSGVHGTGQVVHFETTAVRPEKAWVFGTNANLPDDISVSWAKVVDDEFHARFSATARRYRYICIAINYVQPFCRKGLLIAI